MLEHLVLFKFKQEASAPQIDEAISQLQQLPSKIDDIIELSCGKNFSDRSQGFEYGLRVLLKDNEALERYQKHESHVNVVENNVKPILESILAVDYIRH